MVEKSQLAKLAEAITVDHKLEYTSSLVGQWISKNNETLISPVKPIENIYIDSFNRRSEYNRNSRYRGINNWLKLVIKMALK